MHKSIVGKNGEDLAADFLKTKGFRIIDRNFLRKWGELDIIAIAPDRTLVFVEVKTIEYKTPQFDADNQNLITPEMNLTGAKLSKLQKTSSLYVGENPNLITDKRGWRIDLISVRVFADKHPAGEKVEISHFENI